jgi:hypothetical protein
MNKKIKILTCTMIIFACIAVFGTILPNALDPDETLAGKISIAIFGIIGTILVFCLLYYVIKRVILKGGE